MNIRLLAVAVLAFALSGCATGPDYRNSSHDRYSDNGYNNTRCANCGTVDRIDRISGDRHSNGTGAVVGGIVGGVLGNQVGKGDGRTAATVAGVVAGAVVGNQIEKSQNGSSFDIYVRMDDGRRLIFNLRDLDGIREGSYVQADGSTIRLVH